MKDYSQPEFYKFNSDSIDIVKLAIDHVKNVNNMADFCSGCGVIGLEILNQTGIENCDFVEVNTKFKEYLIQNINWRNLENRAHIVIENYQTLQVQDKYDLIVCNPPYFLSDRARLSDNQDRNRARFFIDSSFAELIRSFKRNLNDSGTVIFSTRFNDIEEKIHKVEPSFKVILLSKRDETLFVCLEL